MNVNEKSPGRRLTEGRRISKEGRHWCEGKLVNLRGRERRHWENSGHTSLGFGGDQSLKGVSGRQSDVPIAETHAADWRDLVLLYLQVTKLTSLLGFRTLWVPSNHRPSRVWSLVWCTGLRELVGPSQPPWHDFRVGLGFRASEDEAGLRVMVCSSKGDLSVKPASPLPCTAWSNLRCTLPPRSNV